MRRGRNIVRKILRGSSRAASAFAAAAIATSVCFQAGSRAGDAAAAEPSPRGPRPPSAPDAAAAGPRLDDERACPEAFRRAAAAAEKYIVEINTVGGLRTLPAADPPTGPAPPAPHPAQPVPPPSEPSSPPADSPAPPKSGEKPQKEDGGAPGEAKKAQGGTLRRPDGSPRNEGGGDDGRRETAKGPPAPVPRRAQIPNRSRPGSGGFQFGDGPGTGIIVSSDGLILTSSFNFASRPHIVTVTLPDGSVHPAEILGRDLGRNMCLLKIPAKDLPVPKFAAPAGMKVGQWAISLGWGYEGDKPAVSVGIISALNRFSGKAVQTDANISPANYGGPLVDIEGRIIGICVPLSPMDRSETAGVEWYDSGIGFAIPLAGLEGVIARMARGETLRPARLGLVPDASPGAAAGDRAPGVRAERIEPGSPAEKAGLKAGDIVVSVDGEPVRRAMDLRIEIGRRCAGDKVKIRYLRDGGTEGEADIVLAEDALPGVPGRLAPPAPGGGPGAPPR